MVRIVKAVTWLGSSGVLWTLIGAAAIAVAIRRRWCLAIYLLVTGAGALTLDPVLKALVGQAASGGRPPGRPRQRGQFSQRAFLGSIVCYGAFLPSSCPPPAAGGAARSPP